MSLSKQQGKWVSYLQTEHKRQEGSFEEYTRYPEFTLHCGVCSIEFKTTKCQHAINFIKEHPAHSRFSMEINVRPNALVYDRETVLEDIVALGKHLAHHYTDSSIVLKETRTTWVAISNEADVQGALERLMSVYKTKGSNAGRFEIVWLRCIINQDRWGISTLNVASIEENNGP